MPPKQRLSEQFNVRLHPPVARLLEERAILLSKQLGRPVKVPEVLRRIAHWYLREKADPSTVLQVITPRGQAVSLDQVVIPKKTAKKIEKDLLSDSLQSIALGAMRRRGPAKDPPVEGPSGEVESPDAAVDEEPETSEGDPSGE